MVVLRQPCRGRESGLAGMLHIKNPNGRLLTLIFCIGLIWGLLPGDAASERSSNVINLGRTNPPNRHVVRVATEEELKQLVLPLPSFPDLRSYTDKAVYAKIKTTPQGRGVIRRMVDLFSLNGFTQDGRLVEWVTRQEANPVAIVIEQGYMTPGHLTKMLSSKYIEQTAPGLFILRVPLVVSAGATFHLDAMVKEFRFSEERGAFLVNDGLLFITDTAVTGWREKENAPARFRREGAFRPFIVSWGGAQLYILNSIITSLGYSSTKSYGVSISQYGTRDQEQLHRSPPTGWLINSTFRDNWFGFYSYEAEDVVILGNSFVENIYYGIDPYHLSRRLIIANNVTMATKIRHGIILSDGVHDSWIVGNISHHNHGAGIVIDHNSMNNLISKNKMYENEGDGISIFESANNLLFKNDVSSNARHGIRVRNSIDIRMFENIISKNKQSGILGYSRHLLGLGKDVEREVKPDSYTEQFSVVVVGGQLIHNGGTIMLDRPLRAQLYRIDFVTPFVKRGIRMSGTLGEYQSQLLDILIRQRAAAIIEPASPPPNQRMTLPGKKNS